MSNYDILLDNQYYLREIIDGQIKIEESIDEIALRITFRLVRVDGIKIDNGMDVKIIGVPYGGSEVEELYSGIVWDIDSTRSGAGRLDVTVYDRAKYLQESEEQWQFGVGTATERIGKYAEAWQIPLGNVPDTQIQLSKALYRPQQIYASIKADLNETAIRGGGLFKARMNGTKLDLYQLGSNETVYVLNGYQEEMGQQRTLQGVITKVKVTGNAKDNELNPILSVKTGNTDDFGTIQKIIHKDEADDLAKADAIAESLISSTFKETFTASGIGVNVIRAGDAVRLGDLDYDLIVKSVSHSLGSIDRMTVQLSTITTIRSELYHG